MRDTKHEAIYFVPLVLADCRRFVGRPYLRGFVVLLPPYLPVIPSTAIFSPEVDLVFIVLVSRRTSSSGANGYRDVLITLLPIVGLPFSLIIPILTNPHIVNQYLPFFLSIFLSSHPSVVRFKYWWTYDKLSWNSTSHKSADLVYIWSLSHIWILSRELHNFLKSYLSDF